MRTVLICYKTQFVHFLMQCLYCLSMLYCIIRSTFSCIRGTCFIWHGTFCMICSAFSVIYGGYLIIYSVKVCRYSRINSIWYAKSVICYTNNLIRSSNDETCGGILIIRSSFTIICCALSITRIILSGILRNHFRNIPSMTVHVLKISINRNVHMYTYVVYADAFWGLKQTLLNSLWQKEKLFMEKVSSLDDWSF